MNSGGAENLGFAMEAIFYSEVNYDDETLTVN